MDTRRPKPPSQNGLPPKPPKSAGKKNAGKKVQTDLLSSLSTCVHAKYPSVEAPGVRSHGSFASSGAEAILYSRSMLPQSHLLLLDVLVALESAIALLKTRRTLPTVAAVGEIVRNSTRREFTIKILSQLAHIVPEAVAVLPGLRSTQHSKRRSSRFIVRLDEVDPADLKSDEKSAARIRRSLLHKRLLDHVREHHTKFLEKEGIKRYTAEVWHPSFDLQKDVEELLAPPLYPEVIPAIPVTVEKKVDASNSTSKEAVNKEYDATADPQPSEDASDSEDCLPAGLLQKVRARSKAKDAHEANVEIEKTTNRSLLSKLPCTMDTICTVLRGGRRSAMGWSQLISKVEKLHPKKWIREDLEVQFNAIVDLGSAWCKKIELKSSRGGFAFRVISDASFGQARSKVSATTCYPSNS